MFVFQLGGGKGNFDDHWPLDWEETATEAPIITRDMWNKIKERQAKIDINIHNARLKNSSRS